MCSVFPVIKERPNVAIGDVNERLPAILSIHPDMMLLMKSRRDKNEVRKLWRSFRQEGRHAINPFEGRSLIHPGGYHSIQTPRFLRRERIEQNVKSSISERKPKIVRDYDALTRTMVPLPNFIDDPSTVRNFKRIHIDIWKKEVKKSVPGRPAFSVMPKDGSISVFKESMAAPILRTDSIFYNSYSKSAQSKFYSVCPEWSSEKRNALLGS